MVNIQTSSKKQKHRHVKRKDRFRQQIYLETPQVPLSNEQHQQKPELLGDWEGAP